MSEMSWRSRSFCWDKILQMQYGENMKCVICGKKVIGLGNNAQPVSNGRCCDYCNLMKVIPQRLADAKEIAKRKYHREYAKTHNTFCICGHRKGMHLARICCVKDCECMKFKEAKKI